MSQELDLLRQVQSWVIRSWMLENYAGGGQKIATWDDFRFHLCGFGSYAVRVVDKQLSWARAARMLKRLHAAGTIERLPHKHHLIFRLPRAECDAIAATVIEELQKAGFSQTEIRTV